MIEKVKMPNAIISKKERMIAAGKYRMEKARRQLPNFQVGSMPMSPSDSCSTSDGFHLWYIDSSGKKYCGACALRPVETDEEIDARTVSGLFFPDRSLKHQGPLPAEPAKVLSTVISNPVLPAHHFLDEREDVPLSPICREGRRIATRQVRNKAVALKFSQSEYDTVRRVAQYLGYSLSQTIRLVMKEKEQSIWPDEDSLPHMSELDSDKRVAKAAAEEKTRKFVQRRKNALQKRSAYVKNQLRLVQEKLEKKENKRKLLAAELAEIERKRIQRKVGTKKMYREIDAEKLHARKMEKEAFADVMLALSDESKRLGRALTESEKSLIGNRVRASVGNEEDLKIEAKVARAVLDKERKIKRKLTVREQWDVRDVIRNRKSQ